MMTTDSAEHRHMPAFGNIKCVSEDSLRFAVYKRLSGDPKNKATTFNRALDGLVDSEFAWRDGEWIWSVDHG
jgi:hypothetical protein